jgi:hypothetical protein
LIPLRSRPFSRESSAGTSPSRALLDLVGSACQNSDDEGLRARRALPGADRGSPGVPRGAATLPDLTDERWREAPAFAPRAPETASDLQEGFAVLRKSGALQWASRAEARDRIAQRLEGERGVSDPRARESGGSVSSRKRFRPAREGFEGRRGRARDRGHPPSSKRSQCLLSR